MKTDTIAPPKEQNHAEQNAKAWVSTLAEMVAKLTREGAAAEYVKEKTAEELSMMVAGADLNDNVAWDEDSDVETMREDVAELIADETLEPSDFEFDEDDARQEIQDSPLSVQTRSGWTNPGEDFEAEEFEILLTTGGPALRIRGELDQHKQPDRAWLEYQDWGTPWTQYFDVEQSTLLTYCQQFYFGE